MALLAACAVSSIVLTGCSNPAATAGSPPSTAATASSNSATESARTRALAATRGLHSYLFKSTSVLNGNKVLVQGRAVIPDRLALAFVSATRHEDIIRIGQTTYTKSGSTPWKHNAAQTVVRSPLAGLLTALSTSRSLAIDPAGRLVGQMSAADATRSGLLKSRTSTAPLTVTFTLDGLGHVTSFSLVAKLNAGGHLVDLNQITVFSGFDMAPPVNAP